MWRRTSENKRGANSSMKKVLSRPELGVARGLVTQHLDLRWCLSLFLPSPKYIENVLAWTHMFFPIWWYLTLFDLRSQVACLWAVSRSNWRHRKKADLLLDTGFEVQPRNKTPTRCTKTMEKKKLQCRFRIMYLKNMSEEVWFPFRPLIQLLNWS